MQKTLSRVFGLRDDLSLSALFRHKQTTTTTVQYDDDSSESPLTEEEEEEEEERKSVAFSFLWSFFVFFLFCVVGLFYYASNSFLVRRIEWPSAAPRRLRTTTKTTKTRTEGRRRRRVGK